MSEQAKVGGSFIYHPSKHSMDNQGKVGVINNRIPLGLGTLVALVPGTYLTESPVCTTVL